MTNSKNKVAPTCRGMVYECQQTGEPSVYVAEHDKFSLEYERMAGGVENILFLCAGSDVAGVQAVAQAVCQVVVDRRESMLPALTLEQQPGEQYVYGYFQTAQTGQATPSWGQGFYIGKGTVKPKEGLYRGRWTSHVDDACAGGVLPRHYTIRAQLPVLEPSAARAWEVEKGLVKKLYGFQGPYAESCAFAVEYFLVSTIYGTYAIDNDTNGNQESGNDVFLARPRYFEATRGQHVFIWSQAVKGFLTSPHDPSNSNTWWPALQTFYADQMSDALNAALQAIGLYPVANVNEGRLRDPQALLRANLNVTGAADCMLTFTTDLARPYRIDLRLSATRNEFMINLRPSTHVMGARLAHDRFTQYLDNHVFPAGMTVAGHQIHGGLMTGHYTGVDPVKNRNQWPFYKPYAPNGNGKQAVWFPVQWSPEQPTTMSFPAVAINGVPWLDPQQGQMSLIEALQALLLAWP